MEKMATLTTKDPEKYCRLGLMIEDEGKKVARALFEKRFEAMTPQDHIPFPWTIDDFLQANKEKILSNQTGSAKERMFFQEAFGTDIEKWDLLMFCFVLVDVCGVSNTIRIDVDQLKKMRNKLSHLGEPFVDNEKYEKYVDKIEVIFDRLLGEIDNQNLKEEIADALKAKKAEPLSIKNTLVGMHKFFSMEGGDMRVIISQQSKEIKEIKEKSREIKRNQDLILKKLVQPESVKVSEIDIVLFLKNCGSDKEEFISNLLVHMYKKTTGSSSADKLSKEDNSKMMAAVRDTVEKFTAKDRPIVDAEKKCVMLRIRCNSVASLLSLLNDCIDGNLNKEFKPLEACIQEIVGCEEVTIEAVMFKEEAYETIRKTFSSLDEMISRPKITAFQSGTGRQNSDVLQLSDVNLVERFSPTTEDERRILQAALLTIRTDPDGIRKLKEYVKSGSFYISIIRLGKKKLDQYDLNTPSIEARVLDEKLQTHAEWMDFRFGNYFSDFWSVYGRAIESLDVPILRKPFPSGNTKACCFSSEHLFNRALITLPGV